MKKNPRRRQFQKNAPWSDVRSRNSLESSVLPLTPLVLSAPATIGDRRPRISTTRSPPQSAATEPWLGGNLCLISLPPDERLRSFLFVLALLHSVDRAFFPCGAREFVGTHGGIMACNQQNTVKYFRQSVLGFGSFW
ncbi:hypothetical protein GW17_00023130 [Ensete ventricosum]|nr:hypothetical protein GW17_00023130 [Ensete ventricosum]